MKQAFAKPTTKITRYDMQRDIHELKQNAERLVAPSPVIPPLDEQEAAQETTTKTAEKIPFPTPIVKQKIPKVGIFGADHLIATTLLELLTAHPYVELTFACSHTAAGNILSSAQPRVPSLYVSDPNDVELDEIDILFVCRADHTLEEWMASCIKKGVRVLDLSGQLHQTDLLDIRSSKPEIWGLPEVVYGLTEFCRNSLKDAQFVAVPGSYATCMNIALAPLAAVSQLSSTVVANARIGTSCMLQSPLSPQEESAPLKQDTLPYRRASFHEQVSRAETFLSQQDDDEQQYQVLFAPQLTTREKGVQMALTTRIPDLTFGEVKELYEDQYDGEPFVELKLDGERASIEEVLQTNTAMLSFHRVPNFPHTTIYAAIDNLQKGAAGQAIQNMNVMMGFRETAGLDYTS